tara:strand:+ start:33627 stop:34778 length:1152 start_codon:yes stop_codon:yes gene_type:complete
MPKLILEERIRYPPFESYRFKPKLLPIATKTETIAENIDASEVEGYLVKRNPPFTVGSEDSWLVEKRYLFDNEVVDTEKGYDTNISQPMTSDSIIDKQRTGWYLTPNPVHAAIRKFLNFAVIVLLVALAYLFLEPVLDIIGLGGFGTGRVRFGLLDYPLLAVFVMPLLFTPILLRVMANLSDLVNQRRFLMNSPTSPKITTDSNSCSNEDLRVKVEFETIDESWGDINVLWRVGILPPSRESLMKSFGRKTNQQPPPGLTTELPHHWEVNLDDGTGGGEESPMESNDVKGGLFIRPMRIMKQSETVKYEGEDLVLKPPHGMWPGTIFSPLIRVHWELVIVIERKVGRSLMWVEPLNILHQNKSSTVAANVNSGRTETNHPSIY